MQPIEGATVRLVVSITGPFGAGKSQLAKQTAAWLGTDLASRVPTDYFLLPRPQSMPLADFLRQPLAWDWPLLDALLRHPVGTATSTPIFDFDALTRRADHGGLPVTVRPVMLIDAAAPYPHADVLVRVHASAATRRRRLAERGDVVRWGTAVLDRWDHLALAEEAARSGQPRLPDLRLDGEAPLAENARLLAGIVRDYLQRASNAP